MKILKKIVPLLAVILLTTPVSAYTLYQYYIDTEGHFPALHERALEATALGIVDYQGTATQNVELLSTLSGKSYEIPESTGTSGRSLSVGAFNPSGGGTYRLKTSLGTTETSVSLSSFKEPVSNILYTMSYLNSTVGYGTIDPSTTRSEFVSFSGITQNSDGSATLTGVSRGLTRTPAGSSCTASTTLAQRHPGQSAFILSDSPCLFQEYAVKRNDETVTGSWSFPTPTTGSNPATKTYVDALVLGGSPTVDKIVVAATAGETITVGKVVYFDTIQDEWMLADASVSASSTQALLGVAQGAGTNGVAITGGVLLHGLDEKNIGGTAGNLVYLSDTTGATSTTAGTVEKVLGVFRSSSAFYFAPDSYISISDNDFTKDITASGSFTASATSSVTIGSFPAYHIGKNEFFASSTGSGTFTVPSGINKVWFELAGGGGGASGLNNGSAGESSPGGGGAGYCTGHLDLSGVSSVAYTIGTAGAGTADGNSSGANGATSTLSTYCTAGKGFGSSPTVPGTGGSATTGTSTVTTFEGQTGGYGLDAGSLGISGTGGSTQVGRGGPAVSGGGSDINGVSGVGFGSGGGGCVASAASTCTGGNGTSGFLRIRW